MAVEREVDVLFSFSIKILIFFDYFNINNVFCVRKGLCLVFIAIILLYLLYELFASD